jgi:sporulation protein YlmC with PRC-barrel domain
LGASAQRQELETQKGDMRTYVSQIKRKKIMVLFGRKFGRMYLVEMHIKSTTIESVFFFEGCVSIMSSINAKIFLVSNDFIMDPNNSKIASFLT